MNDDIFLFRATAENKPPGVGFSRCVDPLVDYAVICSLVRGFLDVLTHWWTTLLSALWSRVFLLCWPIGGLRCYLLFGPGFSRWVDPLVDYAVICSLVRSFLAVLTHWWTTQFFALWLGVFSLHWPIGGLCCYLLFGPGFSCCVDPLVDYAVICSLVQGFLAELTHWWTTLLSALWSGVFLLCWPIGGLRCYLLFGPGFSRWVDPLVDYAVICSLVRGFLAELTHWWTTLLFALWSGVFLLCWPIGGLRCYLLFGSGVFLLCWPIGGLLCYLVFGPVVVFLIGVIVLNKFCVLNCTFGISLLFMNWYNYVKLDIYTTNNVLIGWEYEKNGLVSLDIMCT